MAPRSTKNESVDLPFPVQHGGGAPMSFKQSSKPGHVGHLLTTWPQREDIWAIWAMCQKQAFFRNPFPLPGINPQTTLA
jgi:hypothetical protein